MRICKSNIDSQMNDTLKMELSNWQSPYAPTQLIATYLIDSGVNWIAQIKLTVCNNSSLKNRSSPIL